MPDIQTIEVNYTRKVQLEQFEPIQHGVTVTAELAPDENADDEYDDLSNLAEDMVERAIARRVTQKKLADDDDE